MEEGRRGGGGKRKKEKSFGLEKCLKVQLSASILKFFPLFWKYFTQKLLKASLFAFEEFSSCFISYCLVTKMTYVYSGIIATVFGTTGFLGRYVVQQLGELFVSKLLILVDIMLSWCGLVIFDRVDFCFSLLLGFNCEFFGLFPLTACTLCFFQLKWDLKC